jgi:DNA modification methylase
MTQQIFCGNATSVLQSNQIQQKVDLTFLDPPFNQNKDYACHDDDLPLEQYWEVMKSVCHSIYQLTNEGGAIYFMQREKNAGFVFQTLLETGWKFQNMIIWKKRTSAVPVKGCYGKSYQILVYATKGEKAKTFNRLRIDPPLPNHYKHQRNNGIFVTDIWDDIRELTSGYFAGDEAIRTAMGERFHKQQAPLALLLRIILTSSQVGDILLDPFAGTGTTAVVALQTQRNSINIEIDSNNVECIKNRLSSLREADLIAKYYKDYICTGNLSEIWGNYQENESKDTAKKDRIYQANLLDLLK